MAQWDTLNHCSMELRRELTPSTFKLFCLLVTNFNEKEWGETFKKTAKFSLLPEIEADQITRKNLCLICFGNPKSYFWYKVTQTENTLIT